MPELPTPEPDALAHSARLIRTLAAEIQRSGGWLSFARFMEMALYHPGQGYYSAGATKFGAAGDFVTAPELSPFFGRALAAQVAQVLRETGGDVLEIGPGSGQLAADCLLELERLGRLPARYRLLELSGELKARQRQTLASRVPHLLERIRWEDALPERFQGVVIGNEVLDAMPVHLVLWQEGGLAEQGVGLSDGQFSWRCRPLESGPLFEAAAPLRLSPGYLSEIGLAAQGFVETLGSRLAQGLVLLIDYGFGRREYYHPQRAQGTLMCHYRHLAHADPFHCPGLQDITAHVEFSALAEAGVRAGLTLHGYTTQASFLIGCGLIDLLSRLSPEDHAHYLPAAQQVQRLTSPAEMGELFKVIALTRRLDIPLIGFSGRDMRRLL
ncbi:MAG: SAM-dependent methyltransferase [Betaproteobacteria bacterium]|nr:SAM-dependent methyltransferase [Betaproteobacteria bacterium]